MSGARRSKGRAGGSGRASDAEDQWKQKNSERSNGGRGVGNRGDNRRRRATMSGHRVAVIGGDGIGPEV
ncbi:MAG TPA: hypothetical protein VGG23_04640, partial [Acidimicrobiales bacterium]